MSSQQRFRVTITIDRQGRTLIPVPIDPDQVWGIKSRHPVTGSVGERSMRGIVEKRASGPVITLGPAWAGGALRDGAEVEVILMPEGPQRSQLAPDIAAALAAAPEAAASFDALAQFYRKSWLRWIDSTKRWPDQRPIRIAEMIRLLQAGFKERP